MSTCMAGFGRRQVVRGGGGEGLALLQKQGLDGVLGDVRQTEGVYDALEIEFGAVVGECFAAYDDLALGAFAVGFAAWKGNE